MDIMDIKEIMSKIKTDFRRAYKCHELKGAINYLLGLIDSALRLPFASARPTTLQITVNEGICNLSCEICPPFSSSLKKEISFENFKKIFDACRYIDSLSLAAHGEPFMVQDIFRIIDYAKSKNCEITTVTVTNMTLVDEDIAKKLVDSQFDYLNISFDAASPQLFEKIRKGAKFGEIINNIKTLNRIKKESCSEKPNLILLVTPIKENIYEIPKIVELAGQLDIEGVTINPLRIVNRGLAIEKQSPTNFLKLTQRMFSMAKARAKELGVIFVCPDYRRHHAREIGMGACRQPWKTLNVLMDGTVQPCCSYYSALGNIFNGGIWRVWNNKKFRLIRKTVKKESSICYYCLNVLSQLKLE